MPVRGYVLNRQQAEWIRRQTKDRRGTKNPGRGQQDRENALDSIVYRNDSGEEIPAYGIVRITGYVEENERDVLTVTKPATATGWFMVNGPNVIPDGKHGVAYYGPLVKVLYDSGDSPSVGDVYGVSGFKARSYPSGEPLLQVVIHGVIDATKKIAFARIEPFTSLLVRAPSGGIPGRVGSLLGGATCTVLDFSTSNSQVSVSSVTVKVLNWSTSAACSTGDRYGLANFIDGRWFIAAEDCNDEGSTVQPGTGSVSGGTVKGLIDTTIYPAATILASREMQFTGTATGGGLE